MISKYDVRTDSGNDWVSLADAKRILGVKSAKDLRSLGESTLKIGKGPRMWNVGWLVARAGEGLSPDRFHPDFEWIREYKSHLKVISKARVRKPIKPVPPKPGTDLTSSKRLKQLVKLMPPPKSVPCSEIDWPAVEKEVGVKYPKSFKDFIKVYGNLRWFEDDAPIVPCAGMSPKEFRRSLDLIFDQAFDPDMANIRGVLVEAPRFGEPGGLLPFMMGDTGTVYAWLTVGPSSQWNVICGIDQSVQVLPPMSITEMFVSWLLNEPIMNKIWGTADEVRKESPDRLHLT